MENSTHSFRSASRRRFLKEAALASFASGSWSTVGAGGAAGSDNTARFPDSPEAESDRAFPQGIASGDPRPDGFLLWTRVPTGNSVDVEYQIAESEDFQNIVRAGVATATPDSDSTIRVRAERLKPSHRYWYRFRAREISSHVGRTRTAPLPDDPHPVTMAFASCQDYVGRWYHAWRVLAERADEIDFVLFLGDYIYEYERYPDLQEPQPGRAVKLPDGLVIDAEQGIIAARTLADYRELYRTINSDPDLKRIRRLCPFVLLWDDHEHANDAWQDHTVDFNDRKGDEKDANRRMAATRAWFEHVPVDVAYSSDKRFPDDIVTWRKLRWGKHLELVLTDQRYYRDDHLIPEGPLDPKVGKLLPFSLLGSRTMCIKSVFDEREAKVKPTMLGAPQRDWLIESLNESTATWKVWASALQVAPFILDLTNQEGAPPAFRHEYYFKTDQWDGFPSERSRILASLLGLKNFVVLSGDLHGFYAAQLREHPDDPASATVGVEFTVAGISSISLAEQIEAVTASQKLLKIPGLAQLASQLDENLLKSSPHFLHANSSAYGVALARFEPDNLTVEFLHVDGVREPEWAGPAESVHFRVSSGRSAIERVTT